MIDFWLTIDKVLILCQKNPIKFQCRFRAFCSFYKNPLSTAERWAGSKE